MTICSKGSLVISSRKKACLITLQQLHNAVVSKTSVRFLVSKSRVKKSPVSGASDQMSFRRSEKFRQLPFELVCYFMAWFLILSSLVVIWVGSLCKIIHKSYTPSRTLFLNNSCDGIRQKKNILLLVAHPDDESMFFSPTINYITSRGHNLHILCASIGGADGKGIIRKAELYRACAILQVPHERIQIVDHPDLQDGFGKVWNHSLLAEIIKVEIANHNIDLIITFDNYGVSGHCHHRDVHYGICKVLADKSRENVEAWELVSTNIIRKYSGPIDVWLSILRAKQYTNGEVHCLLNSRPQKSFLAMAQHSSQWLWFRKLFVAFSSYNYVNTLKKIQ